MQISSIGLWLEKTTENFEKLHETQPIQNKIEHFTKSKTKLRYNLIFSKSQKVKS